MNFINIYLKELINYYILGGILIFPLFIISLILWYLCLKKVFLLKTIERKKVMNNLIFKDIKTISILTFISPLIGLLGTVIGMIKTFNSLSLNSSLSSKYVSAGISESLITTEIGLLIAIPGFLFLNYIKKKSAYFDTIYNFKFYREINDKN